MSMLFDPIRSMPIRCLLALDSLSLSMSNRSRSMSDRWLSIRCAHCSIRCRCSALDRLSLGSIRCRIAALDPLSMLCHYRRTSVRKQNKRSTNTRSTPPPPLNEHTIAPYRRRGFCVFWVWFLRRLSGLGLWCWGVCSVGVWVCLLLLWVVGVVVGVGGWLGVGLGGVRCMGVGGGLVWGLRRVGWRRCRCWRSGLGCCRLGRWIRLRSWRGS
jgi:hypothetical protein